LIVLAAWAQAFGQVSLLDTSFQIGLGANDAVNALVVQADQRILAGGEFTAIGGCSNSFLARLKSDGSVDSLFNPVGQTDGAVQCLLQQPDRKVLVGGAFGQLLGAPQPALARLQENGLLDESFDASAVMNTNCQVFSLALQADGRLLVGYYYYYSGPEYWASRIVRLNTNGTADATFVCTNLIGGYVFALLPQPDGSVLCGANPSSSLGSPHYTLFRLKADGQFDNTFDAGLDLSSVFCLVRQTNGQILVGGLLNRTGASNSVPLLRLNANLQWDATYHPDAFGGSADWPETFSFTLLLQPDGKLVVCGYFFEVGGYWRRHIVRLTAEGRVDGCFDPGLGLGAYWWASPVRAIALQPDGRILIGGAFQGFDTALGQANLARLLPSSGCDLIRVYINGGDQSFAAATFPPGGTNYLEMSSDLKNWQTVQTNTDPYISYSDLSLTNPPQAFFRARQER
jgi:uncharacterized delta-60 repeat protein